MELIGAAVVDAAQDDVIAQLAMDYVSAAGGFRIVRGPDGLDRGTQDVDFTRHAQQLDAAIVAKDNVRGIAAIGGGRSPVDRVIAGAGKDRVRPCVA